MVLLLAGIGIFLAAQAWTKWGPIPGLLVGLLFIGGTGWLLLGGFLSMVFAGVRFALNPGRYRQSRAFITAWEERVGPMKPGRPETQPPAGLFPQWFRLWKSNGILAEEFLDYKLGIKKKLTARGRWLPLLPSEEHLGGPGEMTISHEGPIFRTDSGVGHNYGWAGYPGYRTRSDGKLVLFTDPGNGAKVVIDAEDPDSWIALFRENGLEEEAEPGWAG